MVKGINDLFTNSNGYLCSDIFSRELGYNSFSPIKSYEKCCNYITKYITKDCVKNSHNQIYFCSRGLKRADKVEIENIDFNASFSNDYCDILDFDITKISREDLMKYCQIKEVK